MKSILFILTWSAIGAIGVEGQSENVVPLSLSGDMWCGSGSAGRATWRSSERSASLSLQSARAGNGSALKLGLEGVGTGLRLRLAGKNGDALRLEQTPTLMSPLWEPLASFALTNDTQTWPLAPSQASQRFFRAVTTTPPLTYAEDFSLIDTEGKYHHLLYHAGDTNLTAIVLVFIGNGFAGAEVQVERVQQLQQTYQQRGVLFWLVAYAPGFRRAELAEQVFAAGLDGKTLPVLHDTDGLVTRLYEMKAAPAVVCIAPDDGSIFYRGAIASDAPGGEFLASVLERQVNGSPVTLHETAVEDGTFVSQPQIPALEYARDIAPLLQTKCVICHSPGNIAPWAMTNYDIVKSYAPLIRTWVMNGSMPPWDADPEYGAFVSDRSLSRGEKQKLLGWIEAGTPRGTGPDPLLNIPPEPSKWPVELGEPDLVITIPKQSIKDTGIEPYRYIYTQSPLTSDKWLRAAVVRPGNRKVVHHYLVWLGQSDFLPTTGQAAGIAAYAPGWEGHAFPEGTGALLPANTWLTFNLHYTPDGQEETDQPELGLYFLAEPPAQALQTAGIVNDKIVIPPRAAETQFTAHANTSAAVTTVYALYPHMHLRGSWMKFEAVYPDGRRETLLSVPQYRFHWQTRYRLTEPKRLPGGTRIIVTGAYDNSTLNLQNPDPNKTVRWGEQSSDEMFIGYMDYTEEL